MEQFGIKGTCMTDGVYIQDIDGHLWKPEYWNGSTKPNAIAVITPQHNFRIALIGLPMMAMHENCADPWEKALVSFKSRDNAKLDYNGAYNTRQIVRLQPSTDYAAGWCDAYTFPDGVTKGYLPALGELYLACQNKAAIDAALTKCSGMALPDNYHWSSTLRSVRSCDHGCYILTFEDGYVYSYTLNGVYYVRPFGPLSLT